MSQYLGFYLINKETKDHIDLGWVGTSLAREFQTIFPYTEESPLSREQLEDAKKEVISQINELKRRKLDYEKEIETLFKQLPECRSKEVYCAMKEDMNALESFIDELTDEIEAYTFLEARLSIIDQIVEVNDHTYDLAYYNT